MSQEAVDKFTAEHFIPTHINSYLRAHAKADYKRKIVLPSLGPIGVLIIRY
jgi:hypothetical protein